MSRPISKKSINDKYSKNFSKSLFIKKLDYDLTRAGYKITIVGLSSIAVATIVILFNDPSIRAICCIDLDEDKIKDELLEFLVKEPNRIICCSDVKLTANSDIIIIAVEKEDRIDKCSADDIYIMSEYSEKILKNLIPKIAIINPNSLYICIGRPNNILTYLTYKLSNTQKNKVFGIGTYPESIKLQYYLSRRLNMSPSSTLVQVIGSKCTQVPLWESICAGGILLKDIIGDELTFCQILEEFSNQEKKMYTFKNHLNWSSAFAVWLVVTSALNNSMEILPLSCYATGFLDIEEDIFLALPCCLSRAGIVHILQPNVKDNVKEIILGQANRQLYVQRKLGY